MSGKADPKKGPRIVAPEVVQDKLDNDIWCRACGHVRATEAHHLIFRSQGGSDISANIVGLCAPCHHTLHHTGGDTRRQIVERIRRNLNGYELRYLIMEKGRGWLDRVYPWNPQMSKHSRSEPEHTPVPFGGSGSESSGEAVDAPVVLLRAASPDSSQGEKVSTAPEGAEDSLPSPPPPPGTPCPVCGYKKREPKEKDSEENKLKTRWSTAIPKWARSHGEDGHTILTEQIENAADHLARIYGPESLKPKGKGRDYDVLCKVLKDWNEHARDVQR